MVGNTLSAKLDIWKKIGVISGCQNNAVSSFTTCKNWQKVLALDSHMLGRAQLWLTVSMSMLNHRRRLVPLKFLLYCHLVSLCVGISCHYVNISFLIAPYTI